MNSQAVRKGDSVETVDLSGLTNAIEQVAAAVGREVIPAWERWLAIAIQSLLAILTLAAVVYAARSARAAHASAHAARSASDYVYLRDLKAQFDESGYLMRFWRLFGEIDPYRLEHGFWSREITELRQESGQRALWDDALGGNQQNMRYDMLTFYDFVLRLNAWLTRTPGSPPDEQDVRLVNEYFGPWLVGTMLKHRIITCAIKKASCSKTYYLRYYGLRDPHYDLTVALLLADLRERDRLGEVIESSFLKWNQAVIDHLATLTSPGPA